MSEKEVPIAPDYDEDFSYDDVMNALTRIYDKIGKDGRHQITPILRSYGLLNEINTLSYAIAIKKANTEKIMYGG